MTTAKKMQSRVIKIGRVDINVPKGVCFSTTDVTE